MPRAGSDEPGIGADGRSRTGVRRVSTEHITGFRTDAGPLYKVYSTRRDTDVIRQT